MEALNLSANTLLRFSTKEIGLFLVSNTVQESIKETEILPALSSDHSPIFHFLVNTEPALREKNYGNSISPSF